MGILSSKTSQTIPFHQRIRKWFKPCLYILPVICIGLCPGSAFAQSYTASAQFFCYIAQYFKYIVGTAAVVAIFFWAIEHIFGVWSVSKTVRTVIRAVFYTLIPALVFYSALAAQTERSDFPAKEKRRASALVAITFTGALAVVYAVFCGIQIAVLFAGDVSALPEGMTYAEYAREGFFQLLLVSGINVVLIITAQRRFVSSKALRALLVFLTVCTYLMEASSAMRMMLYVNAYGLTYLRCGFFRCSR